MTNPWTQYLETSNTVNKVVNPWDQYNTQQPEPDNTGFIQSTINRIRNMGTVIGMGMNLVNRNQLTPSQTQALGEFAKVQADYDSGEVSGRVASDLGNMFSKANAVESAKMLWGKATDAVDALMDHPVDAGVSAVGSLAALPYHMVESVAGAVSGSVLGVDLSGKEVRALSVDENADRVKALIGNAAAAVAAPAVSKMVEGAFAATSVAPTAEMSTQAISKIATTAPKLGRVGRAIADDVIAGAAAGMVQGAITDANKGEVLASMATGLLFAPLGVVTGYFRGIKGGLGEIENNIITAREIKATRDWQQIQDANIEGAAKKVTNLLSADDIASALKVEPRPEAPLSVDNLYDAFKQTLNEKDNFTSSLVTFAEKHGLKDNLDELAFKFSERYIKDGAPTSEYDHLANLQKQVRESQKPAFDMNDEDLISVATRKGFYFTNNHGALEIRDIETGATMSTAKTSKEAMEFMNATGEVPNTPQLDAGAVLPANVDGGIAPAAHPQLNSDWQPIYTNRARMMAGFDISRLMAPLTGIRPFVEAVDMLTSKPGEFANSGIGERVHTRPMFGEEGTNIKHNVLLPLEHSALKTSLLVKEYLGQPFMRRIDSIGRRVGAEGREHVGVMLEANTIDGLMAPNGYMQNHTVSPDALNLAKFMNENAVDHGLVLNYRRARDAAKFQAIQKQKLFAAETYQNAISQGMESGAALEQFHAQSSIPFEDLPFFQQAMASVEGHFKPDANFMKAVDAYDQLYTKKGGVDDASAVARLKLALDRPDEYGISLEDYVKKNNLSPEIVQLHREVKDAYDHFATRFGIDGRKIMNYMNHYRQIGDISDAFMVDSFERGIMDETLRKFASEMIRSGEIVNYSKDAVGNLYSYVRGGAKRGLYALLDDIGGPDGALAKELNKIADEKIRGMVIKRFDDYTRDIVGQQSLNDREALAAQVHILKNLVEENGQRKSLEQIIAEVNKPSNLDTLLNLSASGLLGGRISLAMRDNFDVWQKFYVRNGGERLWKLLTTKLDEKVINQLIDEGNIVNPDPIDIINVTHQLSDASKLPGQRLRNAQISLNQASKELARFGFETSLQGRAYVRNQAAVFLETAKHTSDVLGDLAKGKLTKEAAYEKLFINKYDIPTQRIFDAYVKDGLFSDAVKLLAKEEVVQVATRMTRGNQAPIMSTGVGKLFGQMGSWGMANRTVLENMLTRGTTKEVARSMTRYAISLNATILAGAASGLNLGRWLLLPMSVVATGGPVLGFGQAIVSGTSAALGGDPTQTNFTNRAMKTGLSQFVPFSYATKDLMKGAGLATEGDGYGVMRPAAQMIGIGVNRTRRNMLDLITGNYPIAP